MSLLNSKFDIISGLPPVSYSALELNLPQSTNETQNLTAGNIVKIVNINGKPYFARHTSSNTSDPPDYPFVVAVGLTASDGATAGKVTAFALKSGLIFKVETSESFNVGDLVYAQNGAVKAGLSGKQAIGQVIEVNTSGGWILVATGI